MAAEQEGWAGSLGKAAVGAVAGAFALWLIGWLNPLWSFTQQASGSLWTHLMAHSHWPNWSAYALSLVAAWACFSWALRHWRSSKDSTWRFHQLSFRGVVWRWAPTSGLPHVVRGYCPVCDTRLVYMIVRGDIYTGTPTRTEMHCETCDCRRFQIEGDLDYMNARIIREIDRLHRTGEWRKHVAG